MVYRVPVYSVLHKPGGGDQELLAEPTTRTEAVEDWKQGKTSKHKGRQGVHIVLLLQIE